MHDESIDTRLTFPRKYLRNLRGTNCVTSYFFLSPTRCQRFSNVCKIDPRFRELLPLLRMYRKLSKNFYLSKKSWSEGRLPFGLPPFNFCNGMNRFSAASVASGDDKNSFSLSRREELKTDERNVLGVGRSMRNWREIAKKGAASSRILSKSGVTAAQ